MAHKAGSYLAIKFSGNDTHKCSNMHFLLFSKAIGLSYLCFLSKPSKVYFRYNIFRISFAFKIQGQCNCNNHRSLQQCYVESKNRTYIYCKTNNIGFFSCKQLQHFSSQFTSVSLFRLHDYSL